MKCPHCGKDIPVSLLAASLGAASSPAKKISSAKNGAKGGRPKKLSIP